MIIFWRGASIRFLLMLLIGAMATLVAAPPLRADIGVRAGGSAEDYLKPIVTQQQFTDLLRPLDLTREQRMIVELVYEDYREAVDRARRDADREADANGRRVIAEALAGQRLVPAEQLQHYRLNVLKVYRDLPGEAGSLLDRLISDVRSVARAEQRPMLDEQMPALRRTLYLHPRRLGRVDYEYAGDGVDVLLLADAARAEEGELADVPQEAIMPILQDYEREIDSLLKETAIGHLEATIDARMARIAGDDGAMREAERRSLDSWRALYELNEHTVERIAEVAAQHGGEAAGQQWRARFQREVFAWMFTPTRIDRMVQWMNTLPLDEARLEQAAAVHEQYQDERWPLRREAADIMIRARLECETVVYAMMDPGGLRGRPQALYRELLLNSGRLAAFESRAAADLESLLDPDERRRMRRDIAGR